MFSLEISGFAIKTFISAQSVYHASPLTPAACGSSYTLLHWLTVGLPENDFRGLAKDLSISQSQPREKFEPYTGLGSHTCPEEGHLSGYQLRLPRGISTYLALIMCHQQNTVIPELEYHHGRMRY